MSVKTPQIKHLAAKVFGSPLKTVIYVSFTEPTLATLLEAVEKFRRFDDGRGPRIISARIENPTKAVFISRPPVENCIHLPSLMELEQFIQSEKPYSVVTGVPQLAKLNVNREAIVISRDNDKKIRVCWTADSTFSKVLESVEIPDAYLRDIYATF